LANLIRAALSVRKGFAGSDQFGYPQHMPNRSRKPKRRPDLAQLAKLIPDEATGEVPPTPAPGAAKDPAAVALGRKGGLIGGKVRAANMTKRQRSDAAKRAAAARWGKQPKR
jgi:hypothetical protein